MAGDPVLLRDDHEGGIVLLRLNRPAARNALSEALIDALAAALDRVATERATRVVVIAAEGPAFCAGHDLKEMTARRSDPDRGRAYFTDLMGRCAAMMTKVVRSPKPVIAAVEGVATAAGCQLVASCDLAVAGEKARFATPGVDIGLFCSTPMVALTRNVPRKHAMAMLLTGDMVAAEEAARIGLVNRVVAAGQAESEALALARRIAAKSPKVLRIGKEAFHRQIEMGLDDAYAYTAGVMVENMLAAEAEEGIGAFIEKREPRWDDAAPTPAVDDPALKRTRWRSWHRGMREMDLLLGPFADARLHTLAGEERALYEAFLDVPDQIAFSWLVENKAAEPRFEALIKAILAHAAANPIPR